jgi:tRNA-dihydrouridine synthase
VAAVRRAVGFPLWVKFRTGWRDDPQAAVDMARRFEDAGADALTFHPRVAPDVRSRRPKWAYIEKVKAAVAVPVFGNGDVFDARDCERMLRTTGCDGVALGRLAIARPWVFAAWTRGLLSGPHLYRDTALTLATLLPTYFDAATAHRRFNRFAAYFAANFRFGHTLWRNLRQTRDLREVDALLGRFFETPPEVFIRPNLGLLR